jgi:hypothetical protein
MSWIRRIPGSPNAAEINVDTVRSNVVEFRQFLTIG